MNIDHLDKIQKAEINAFLFTRIEQRIAETRNSTFTKQQVRLLGFAIAIVLFINATAIISYVQTKSSVGAFANAIQLTSDNSLY
jgi:hypothetical protein